MILDTLENASRYASLHPLFPEAFAAIGSGKLEGGSGKILLRGETLYAFVTSYQSKPPESGRLETHRKYIDIQAVISGEEICGWAPSAGLEPLEPYNDAKDVAFWKGAGMPLVLRPGLFAVFFPEDAHAPGLALSSPTDVAKLVLKVAV